MLLQTGTVIPALGNAVYGDRPVIIGFLHLVFLGFVSFFMLCTYLEQGYFTSNNKRTYTFPFLLFAIAVILNEALLMIQGFSILFQSNSQVFNWLLWIASILLFLGALSLVISRAYAAYRYPNDIRI